MIKQMRKFTSYIHRLQTDSFGYLNLKTVFLNFNRSLFKVQPLSTFSTSNKDLLRADIEGLHNAVISKNSKEFISLLPLLRRKNATIEIAEIITDNISTKNVGLRNDLTLPILTQASGAGKSFFIKNLPRLFETYCPDNLLLKESYHIYVRLNELNPGEKDILEKLYALIFYSFLVKYKADPTEFPKSLSLSTIEKLAAFITGDYKISEFEIFLKKYKVSEEKIKLIVKDFENRKYTRIIFELDELKAVEDMSLYSEKEKIEIREIIQKNLFNSKMYHNDIDNLIRLYYFWDKILVLMKTKYFEVIVAGKGTSGLLGKKILIDSCSPSEVSQIILDPLSYEDVCSIIEETLIKPKKITTQINSTKISQEIYHLTAGHPLYVGYSLYLYYKSLVFEESGFDLKKTLKEFGEVKGHINRFIDNVKIYKNVEGLKSFFDAVIKSESMDKEKIHYLTNEHDSYMTTVELLDNLGISYSNAGNSVIPILPYIFKEDFLELWNEDIKPGPMEKGLKEENEFMKDFLYFSEKLYKKSNQKNIDIKKMFPFLQNFPDFMKTKSLNKFWIQLPTISKASYEHIDKDCDIMDLKRLHPKFYGKLLENLKVDTLYKHGEASSSSDFIYVKRFLNSNKKLFLFFQIKHVTTKIDLNQEYVKNFQKTYLKLQKDCIYRLIILNTAKLLPDEFGKDEAYKVFKYQDDSLKPLLYYYNEMHETELVYHLSFNEVFKSKKLGEKL